MKNKYGELAKNTVIFAAATLGAKIIMFLLMPLYTNVLSTAEYGTVELIITGINLLTPIITLSITDAILRFGLDKTISHGVVLKDSVVFLTGASLLTIICSPLIKLYQPLSNYVWIFVVTMIVFMFRSLFTFYLKSIDKNLFFAIDTIIYTLVLALLNILLLAVFKMGVEGYMLSLTIASLVSIVFCICVSGAIKDLIRSGFDSILLKKMLLYSAPLVLNAISWWITNSSDKYMLEFFCSEAEVGLYSAAAKIPALLSAVNSLFSQAWTLSSVKEYDTTADRKFFSNIFRMFTCVMIMASAFILLITKPFMSIYVGPEFYESWKYVPVLLVAALFGSCSSFFGSIYVATRKNINCTISTAICGVTNIILNALLIPHYGIMGAAIATAVSYAVIGIYRMLDCQRTFSFEIEYAKHLFAIVIVLIEMVLVVMSDYRYLFSAIAIVCLLIIYRAEVKDTIRALVLFIQRKKKRG